MEQQSAPQPMPVSDQIGFPSPVGEKKSSGGAVKWIVVVLGIVLIVAGGAFFLIRTSGDGGDAESTPTPQGNTLSAVSTPTPFATSTATPTPTASASAEPVDNSETKVQVLNGTGTAGDAGLAKTALTKLGFEDITTANADEQEETDTTVTYSSEIETSVIDEIVEELEKIFATVKTRKGTIAGDFEIRIVTGEKK